MKIDLKTNIYNNLKEYVYRKNIKINLGKYDNLQKLLYEYYFWIERHIPIMRRTVKISSNLKCPKDLQKMFYKFIEKVKNGDDLNPYLSRKTCRFGESDSLLSYWQIHHFHLGELKQGKKFSERTNFLAFACFCGDIAYIIDVNPHGSWYDFSLIETVCKEFPDVINQYRMKDRLEDKFIIKNDQEIKNIRKLRLNVPIDVNGISYFKPSVMSNGKDWVSTLYTTIAMKKIKIIENYLLEKEELLLKTGLFSDKIVVTTENWFNDIFVIKIKANDINIGYMDFYYKCWKILDIEHIANKKF